MLTNDRVREDLKKYIEANGKKQRYIAKQCDISPASICLFLKNLRDLRKCHLQAIDKLIKSA